MGGVESSDQNGEERAAVPELPEVETMRRGVLGIVGGRVVDARRTPCRRRPIVIEPTLRTLRRRMLGRRVAAVDRLGKRLCVRLDGGDALVIEPRMTGIVATGVAPTREHVRFRLAVEGAACDELLFWDRRGLGTIRLLSPEQQTERLGPDRLGPDALAVTAAALRRQFATTGREIKPALLDQRRLAGVGNLYASEILHVAAIDPTRRCRDLTPAEWKRIHAAMRRVLTTAIRYEGSTLSDGTYRNALSEPGRYQNEHRVYDKAGRTCGSCRTESVVRIVQAQRSTFFCPACQPAT